MDPVHGPVDLFHAFSLRKILQLIPKIAGALYFYKTPPDFLKIIF
jgi:hypothetical protein